MKRAVLLTIICMLSFGTVRAEGGRSIEMVLDASGSMKARLPDGTTRIEAAKAAIADMVTKLPPQTRLGFRVYGINPRRNGRTARIRRKDPTSGEWIRTFAVVTVPANPLVARIHDRMPAILKP